VVVGAVAMAMRLAGVGLRVFVIFDAAHVRSAATLGPASRNDGGVTGGRTMR
jgi:hypothetical protein